MAKQNEFVRITLRMPTEMHDKLSAICEQTSRSLNGEILFRLGESLISSAFEARQAELHEQINELLNRLSAVERRLADRHLK